METLAVAVFLPLLLGATALILSSSRHVPLNLASHCRSGFAVGVVLAVVLLGLDLFTEQGLSRWVLTKIPFLSDASNRHVIFDKRGGG